MLNFIKIYFGFAEDNRQVEGWFSWQHILYATSMTLIAVLLAVFLGKTAKKKGDKFTHKVMVVATVLMLSFELFKIILICIRVKDAFDWLSMLPLFICSIMLFAVPIATFGKGRVRQSATDFAFIFGVCCMLAGNYLSANYFTSHVILSFDPMVSVTTHTISGFFGIFVGVSGKTKLEKKRILDYTVILAGFILLALLADLMNQKPNVITGQEYEANYMFLMDPKGTPFTILWDLAGGIKALYAIFVSLIYFVYMYAFLGVYFLVTYLKNKPKQNKNDVFVS